ncbi:MAG TPA: bifunctional riboflavin kinase/FAD synthetase [Syntrophorhabdaceae bacterium]|nr:bifunctional riboflavin kinase/FAD synthetase [Syntrophorhabdaceae bacterium]
MKIFESLGALERFPNPVVTIGNYDGIHIGHRRIIAEVVQKARQISGTPMLMTFYPHPQSVLNPEAYTRLVTPLHLKKKLIETSGIEVLVIVSFDETFRNVGPESFVKDVLVSKVGVKAVVIGYDFRFGKAGAGDIAMLKRLAGENGFSVDVVDAVTIEGEKVGSNMIRKLIMNGEVGRAAICLGRPHVIEGIVVKGEKRGRDMGFPTINLETISELVPKNGVYVTEVEVDNIRLPAVTNIGFNPTFDGTKLLVETYILDFSGDLYGREVAIHFHERIRDEIKFESMDALKERIAKDVEVTRSRFQSVKTGD